MNGRIYDPLLGRFLSADVFVEHPADLQSYNRYTYVRNRPLTFTDPSGFDACEDAIFGPELSHSELAELDQALAEGRNPRLAVDYEFEKNNRESLKGITAGYAAITLPAAACWGGSTLVLTTGARGIAAFGLHALANVTVFSSGRAAERATYNAIDGRPMGQGTRSAAGRGAVEGLAMTVLNAVFGRLISGAPKAEPIPEINPHTAKVGGFPGELPKGSRVVNTGRSWYVLEHADGAKTIRFRASDATLAGTPKRGPMSAGGTRETEAFVNTETGSVYVTEGQHRVVAVAADGVTVDESVPNAEGWLEYQYSGTTTKTGNAPTWAPGQQHRKVNPENPYEGLEGYD